MIIGIEISEKRFQEYFLKAGKKKVREGAKARPHSGEECVDQTYNHQRHATRYCSCGWHTGIQLDIAAGGKREPQPPAPERASRGEGAPSYDARRVEQDRQRAA